MKTLLFSLFTCTMEAISMGSMARGNRRMLKSEMDVKAFSAVKMLSELTPTNTAKVARETCPWKKEKENNKAISPQNNRSLSPSEELVRMTYQSRSAGKDERWHRCQVCKLLHNVQLFTPNTFYLSLERWLPCKKFQNLKDVRWRSVQMEKAQWKKRKALIVYVEQHKEKVQLSPRIIKKDHSLWCHWAFHSLFSISCLWTSCSPPVSM